MRAIKSWLSLLAAVVALLVANPGCASVVGASGHSVVTAAAPFHCANMLGHHAPAGSKRATSCEHCPLCGVAFVAPPETPTANRFAKVRRLQFSALERAALGHEQASAHRARAPPIA